MTYDPVVEAKKKPRLNPNAKILGKNMSPEVKAETDRMIAKVISSRVDYTPEEIDHLFREEPVYFHYMDELKKDLDAAPKVDSETEGQSNATQDDDEMTPEKENTLKRMRGIIANMTLPQIKILKNELLKGAKV